MSEDTKGVTRYRKLKKKCFLNSKKSLKIPNDNKKSVIKKTGNAYIIMVVLKVETDITPNR